MLSRIEENCFFNEETFYICGTVDRHNCKVWGSEYPYEVNEYECHSPKVKMWYAVMKNNSMVCVCMSSDL